MPRRPLPAAAAQAATAEFAGAGWDATRALMPFANEFGNILVQGSILPPFFYAHGGLPASTPLALRVVSVFTTNFFDLAALTGMMLNVVHAAALHGQGKGLRVGIIVAFFAFIVPNLIIKPLTNAICGCELDACAGVAVAGAGGERLKPARVVAGVSIVWILDAIIELCKELTMHPHHRHAIMGHVVLLLAAVGWNGSLHVALNYGRAAVGALRTRVAAAAKMAASRRWGAKGQEGARLAVEEDEPEPEPAVEAEDEGDADGAPEAEPEEAS